MNPQMLALIDSLGDAKEKEFRVDPANFIFGDLNFTDMVTLLEKMKYLRAIKEFQIWQNPHDFSLSVVIKKI